MQNVFTDRRAYVNALTYDLETDTSQSGKESKQKDMDNYKKKPLTVEFPDGTKKSYDFPQLEENLQRSESSSAPSSARSWEMCSSQSASQDEA